MIELKKAVLYCLPHASITSHVLSFVKQSAGTICRAECQRGCSLSGLRRFPLQYHTTLWHNTLRPVTHYSHVTWAHVMLRVRLGCERRFNIELYGADSHFCHFTYVTWSHVELWSAHVPACLWEACWHVSWPELHVRSRDVSRVTEVWICSIEFNVKSLLTSQLHA